MKLELFSVFVLFVGVSYAASIEKCHMERLNSCGEPLKSFRKEIGQKFPTTEEQVNKLCDNLDQAQKCMDKFRTECMTPLQLQLVDYITEGSVQVYREFCTPGSEIREDYIKHAPCMNDAYETDEFKGFTTYVEAALEDLMEKPQNQRLQTACCGYQWFTEKSTQLGEEKCGAEAVDSFRKVLEMAVSTIPSVLCQGFEPDSKECTSVLPPPGATPKGTIKNSHVAKLFSEIYLED